MAVVSCKLLFTSRGGKDTFEHHRTYTREYEVITDDPNDGEFVVGNDPGIPDRGDVADFDDEAFVVSIDCQQSADSMLIWYVTVEYDTEPPYPQATDLDGNPQNPGSVEHQSDPLSEPPTWKITTQDSEEPAIEGRKVDTAGFVIVPNPPAWTADTPYKVGEYVKNLGQVYVCVAVTGDALSASAGGPDSGGTGIVDHHVTWNNFGPLAVVLNDPNQCIFVPIHNSGNLPFDPPAMVEVSRAVLSVTVNMPFASLAYLLTLKNAVNVTAWRGIPPRCAKILKLEHEGGRYKNGVAYVKTSWEIGLDPDTWDLRILDAGYGCIQTRSNEVTHLPERKYVAFKDVNGEPLTEPVPMNGAGLQLSPDDTPIFLRFIPRQCRLIDFNATVPF